MTARPWILILAILLGACAAPEPEGATGPVPGARAEVDDEAWTRALIAHREEIEEEFKTSKTSPMAGAQRLTSEGSDTVHLARRGRTFALGESSESTTEMTLVRREAGWVWEDLGEGVACEVGDGAAAKGTALSGPASCNLAGLHLSLYPSDDSVTFIVYDPERGEKVAFEHLLYFPPDRSFAVPARLVRLDEPEEVEMLTSRSLKKTFYRYARMHFQLGDEDLELTAFKYTLDGEGSDSLFVPFRDGTSGQETYGAGRFMDLEEPEGDQVVLDFNRAYNPLCNYSPAFNCPIPPRENRLSVAVRAGERAYPH